MEKRRVPNEDASLLTRLMDLDAPDVTLWESEDLAAVFQHQLSASVDFDVGGNDPTLTQQIRALGSMQGPLIESFRDLLHHPSPPIELLEMTKRFAKSCRSRPGGPLPDEIATVLYLLSIVVAMTRRGKRITKLDNQGLRYGLDWALGQTWLDEPTRKLLDEGRRAVETPSDKTRGERPA